MIFYWKLGRKNDSVDTTGNCQQTKRVISRFYPWKECKYLRFCYKTAAKLMVVCWNSSRKLLQNLNVSKYLLGASATKECWLTMQDSSREVVFSHRRLCVGGRGTMRHGTNSKGALIPPYRQNSGAHIVNTGTDRQSSWGIPRQFLPALGWISLLHPCHRTSCREELAKPLLFFQGSLKDISHKNLFLLP